MGSVETEKMWPCVVVDDEFLHFHTTQNEMKIAHATPKFKNVCK